MSVGVGITFDTVCLFVVCPQHNSKTNDPKVFKLGVYNVYKCLSAAAESVT